MKKRILSVLLCLCMVMALLPTTALATHNHGTTGISSLSDDMTAGSYYLTDDVTLSTAWTPANDVTLCLNGHTLTLQAGITVSSGKTLTITNCGSTGKILRDTGFTSSSMFTVSGNLSLNNVTIDGNSVTSTANALYVSGGHVDMEGGIIQNCVKSTAKGGAVYVTSSGTFNMTGGSMVNNQTQASGQNDGGGGALSLMSGTATLNNSVIQGNQSPSYGGAVYVGESSSFTMTGGSMVNNQTTSTTTTYGGGALYNKNTVELNGVTLTGNTSTRGGAVYNSSYGTLTIIGAVSYTHLTLPTKA